MIDLLVEQELSVDKTLHVLLRALELRRRDVLGWQRLLVSQFIVQRWCQAHNHLMLLSRARGPLGLTGIICLC